MSSWKSILLLEKIIVKVERNVRNYEKQSSIKYALLILSEITLSKYMVVKKFIKFTDTVYIVFSFHFSLLIKYLDIGSDSPGYVTKVLIGGYPHCFFILKSD